MLGPWYASGKARDAVTVLTGIRERAGTNATVLYARGCGITDTATAGFAAALQTAARAQVVVVVLGEAGEMSGEAASRSSLGLPGVQQQLLERVTRLGKPVVLVLMNGRPLALPWAAAHVPAILETWFLGVEAGHAIADVVYGDVSPSGKLPVTVPRSVGQIPIYYNHKNGGRPPSATDKFTSKYLDLPSTPLYPFGWGLSYTTFRYDSLQLSTTRVAPTDSVVVRVTVTNVGSRAGTEIVQLYVSDEDASVTRPVRQLAGFQRVPLDPRETRTVTFALGAAGIGFYGQDMTFTVEPGPRRVFVGSNADAGLEVGFTVVRGGGEASR
jgi:beta-glucosidase